MTAIWWKIETAMVAKAKRACQQNVCGRTTWDDGVDSATPIVRMVG